MLFFSLKQSGNLYFNWQANPVIFVMITDIFRFISTMLYLYLPCYVSLIFFSIPIQFSSSLVLEIIFYTSILGSCSLNFFFGCVGSLLLRLGFL